jgi:co-chaperonin GroES (HSP10)
VLVELESTPAENTSVGGILLPQPVLIRYATVLAVGPGRRYSDGVYKPCEIQVGERVVFLAAVLDTKQGHQLVGSLGENEALVREPDILCVIESGNPRIEK